MLEELGAWVNAYPAETITALDLVAHGTKERHEIEYKIQEYRDILAKVLSSDSETARRKASDLINYLGERGFVSLRDLLPTSH